MSFILGEDQITLDSERITEHTDPVFGAVTVFHDVTIASEMVQEYPDGKAFKDREELQEYTHTVDHRWITVGKHPDAGIVSDRSQIHGRSVNPRYVKDLMDPKTKRPNRAGVRADLEFFNDRIAPDVLKDMKNGKKQDVSIGFFYTKDDTPGIVNDGPFKGIEYDYVQRNMFHDHLAAGIDNGRCPSPLCGLSADEIKRRILVGDPFAGFEDFEDCVSSIMEENPDYSREQAEATCGELKKKYEDTVVEEEDLVKAKRILRALLEEEYEALRGEREALQDQKEWWRNIDWKNEGNRTMFDALNETTRQLIIDEGLCPTCGQDEPRTEAERAMSHFEITEEEWGELSEEEKQEYIDKLPERGSGDEVEYEDGPAVDFKLIPVDNKEEDEETEEPEEDEKDSEEETRDVSEVLERASRVLDAVNIR